MNAQFKGHLIGAVIGLAIVALLHLLGGCGRDETSVPVLQADPSTGAVTVKGDRGEKGEKGDAGERGERGEKGDAGAAGTVGAKGDTGASGKDGKDGQDAPVKGAWVDPITAKTWLFVQGKYTADQIATICATWKIPKGADLADAIKHGLYRQLTPPVPAATERAWASELAANNDQRAVTALDADETVIGNQAFYSRGNLFRVYCVKE